MEENQNKNIFDYNQELARSGFADMLHDTERNHKYAMALKEAIEIMKNSGRQANVLDIGTGSGLLAMLAAKYGADSVTTIEAYSPVSHIARQVIATNGFAKKIKIISKHSNYVKVGPGLDMDRKANILVAELFDTELIGEGAIKSYNEAHIHLMETECICVPNSAQIYVQIVESDLAESWNIFKDVNVDGKILQPSREMLHCSGFGAINDLQLSQFPLNEFKAVTNPFQVTEIDFSGRQSIQEKETFMQEFETQGSAKSTIIFFWWELHMNQSGSILLSCAPHWAHPDTNTLSNNSPDEIVRRNCLPWRDHWMQGCYFINKSLKKDHKYFLRTQHDEFSWKFAIFHSNVGTSMTFEQDFCKCFYHYNSKNTIMQMNDIERRNGFIQLLKNRKQMKNVLFVGDHNYVSLIAAGMEIAENIFIFQENRLRSSSLEAIAQKNGLNNKIKIFNYLNQIPAPITDLICDMNFEEAVNPIHGIVEFLKILKTINIQEVNIHPRQIIVNALPVSFLHLHKIRWPLQSSCEGFEHANFDIVLERASSMADENVEPFSLWEYPCFPLGLPSCVFSFVISDGRVQTATISKLLIEDFSKPCNGIAFWLEWKLDDDIVMSSGPKTPVKPNELVNWKFDRQAVHLIPYQHVMAGVKGVEIQFAFNQNFEDISFKFAYHHC